MCFQEEQAAPAQPPMVPAAVTFKQLQTSPSRGGAALQTALAQSGYSPLVVVHKHRFMYPDKICMVKKFTKLFVNKKKRRGRGIQ